MPMQRRSLLRATLGLLLAGLPAGQREVSGVYPHLAAYNLEDECGVGAVVPWAGRLWFLTYAPHRPRGSSDLLYEVTPQLELVARPESIGGTPANRMIHAESEQLFLGPYAIDRDGGVRVVPYDRMPGRPTGLARHLEDPRRLVYLATMEEGLYEIDVETLEVTELYADDQGQLRGDAHERRVADLPGYHGKGLYSGQGRLVYANNGEPGGEALRRPDVPSGCLAEWGGERNGKAWRVVRRAQFTEVTGPGGIRGNADPARDPLWSIGWDHRSLILMVLDGGAWSSYRLPKGSHAYDGAHGWNTEWPRIRDVEEEDLLMTMHGTFWSFPRAFRPGASAGLAPRSSYLKVVGDFCRWGERIVLGCDDAARSEFLNTRRAKGEVAGPGASHSNLWFVEAARLDALGPALGRGAVWLRDGVRAGEASEPFLAAGYEVRTLHISHSNGTPVAFRIEVDESGDGAWGRAGRIVLPPGVNRWLRFDWRAQWIRLVPEADASGVTAIFHYAARDERDAEPDPIFEGLARGGIRAASGGLLRAGGFEARTLSVAAVHNSRETPAEPVPAGLYELDAALRLRAVDDRARRAELAQSVAVPIGVLLEDAASWLYVDDDGGRWRLPKHPDRNGTDTPFGPARVSREVVTERDLFHCGGTFYELPARNAGGFRGLRPIATHPFAIHDYASYRGLLVLTGVDDAASDSAHVVRSDDGEAAVWVGVVDDLWRLGKPRGVGGPWANTDVGAGVPSDPYLVTGYDRKRFTLSHDAAEAVRFTLQVDVTGPGDGVLEGWVDQGTYDVPAGSSTSGAFPAGYSAYWLRAVVDRDCVATARFTYD